MGQALGSHRLTPAVTVLMAVYDPPVGMLEQAVESVLNQTFASFEFLIVDDGGRDPGVRAWLCARGKHDARIRVVEQPHHGLTASLNFGLGLARGSLVARQDADDWSEPVRLERQVEYFRQHPEAAVLGTATWTHQEDGRPLWRVVLPLDREAILSWLPRGNPFVHGSVMFSRTAAVAAGGYREEFCCSQDYDFLWRLAEGGGAANLAEPLYHYRYSKGSVSAGRAEEQARAHRAIQRLAAARSKGETTDIVGTLAEIRNEKMPAAQALLKQADHLMLAGDYGRAWAAYASVLRTHPVDPRAWAKFARLGVFWTFPCLREACFR